MIEKWGHEAGDGKRGERSPKKRGGGVWVGGLER